MGSDQDDTKPSKPTSIRFSPDEVALLEEVRRLIADGVANPEVRITQRAAIVTALRFYVARMREQERA